MLHRHLLYECTELPALVLRGNSGESKPKTKNQNNSNSRPQKKPNPLLSSFLMIKIYYLIIDVFSS